MNKTTRTINLILEIDWEDYEDVDEQLILEDAIMEITEGARVSVDILKSLDIQLNDFGNWLLLHSSLRSSNDVAKAVSEYIKQLK